MEMKITCSRYIPGDGKPCHYYIPAEDQPGFCSLPDMFRCIEACKAKLPRLSHSSKQDFERCKYYYYLNNIVGVKLKEEYRSHDLIRGTLWGEFLSSGGTVIPEWDDAPPKVVAEVRSLARAYQALEIQNLKEEFTAEEKVYIPVKNSVVYGKVDRAYPDHIVESKCTRTPENYDSLFKLTHQVGIYLYSNKKWEYCMLEATRYPQLRLGKSETLADFEERCLDDIIKRPSHYFYHLNKDTMIYGRKYYRNEFPLDELFSEYVWTLDDISATIRSNRFSKSYGNCFMYNRDCDFKPICLSGGRISDTMYEYRNKKQENVNEDNDTP